MLHVLLVRRHPFFTAQWLALERYSPVLSTTPELPVTGLGDQTLFLWSLFPSSVPSSATSSTEKSSTGEKGGKLKPITRLTGHQRQISHVAFSPDGRWAASASWDNSVRFYFLLLSFRLRFSYLSNNSSLFSVSILASPYEY